MRLERRHALWLLIAAAHLGLLKVLAPHAPAEPRPAGQRVVLELLPLPRAIEPRREAGPQRPAVPARQAGRTPARIEMPAIEVPPNAPPPEPVADVAEPAAVPPPTSLLVNSEATRQAIRQAARAPLLSERAASASQAPGRENAQERLGREVARTAYGNCLKGEFPGGGMGLLSLPFWIAAETSGKCKK